MSRRVLINLVAAVVVVLLLWWIGRASKYQPTNLPRHAAADTAGMALANGAADSEAPGALPGDSTAAASASLQGAAAQVRHAEIGFASTERLADHFEKHGAEFKVATADGYLLLAQALRDRPAGGDVLEARRSDGVITRFDRASGAFIAFDNDRTIRTFFRPNDGENYFWRQLGRPH